MISVSVMFCFYTKILFVFDLKVENTKMCVCLTHLF